MFATLGFLLSLDRSDCCSRLSEEKNMSMKLSLRFSPSFIILARDERTCERVDQRGVKLAAVVQKPNIDVAQGGTRPVTKIEELCFSPRLKQRVRTLKI